MSDAPSHGFDAARLRAWIGRTAVAHEEVSAVTAARLAATLGDARTFAPGDALPPLWHWTLFAEVAPPDALGRDGHPALGGFLPDVGSARRMWAGGRVRWSTPLRIGERARRTSTIVDVVVKAGRSGDLCFVTVEHRVDADGAPRLVEEHDIVYRGDAGDGGARAATAFASLPAKDETTRRPDDADADADADAGAGADAEFVLADAVLLFRYSALTFNGHRIHYDRDYATGVEGYPGLVVHGPLVATLLAGRAARLLGAGTGGTGIDGTGTGTGATGAFLHRFEYRARAPAFDGATIELRGTVSGPPAGQPDVPGGGDPARSFAGLARVAGTTIMTCTAA